MAPKQFSQKCYQCKSVIEIHNLSTVNNSSLGKSMSFTPLIYMISRRSRGLVSTFQGVTSYIFFEGLKDYGDLHILNPCFNTFESAEILFLECTAEPYIYILRCVLCRY